MLSGLPVRFLVAGAFNFAFGYGVFALFWRLFGSWCPDYAVVLAATLVGIAESFLAHRFFTYRSRGCWWREYLRFHVVYGVQTLLDMAAVRVFVTCLGYNAYAVQLVTLVALTVVTYWAHKLYSFSDCPPAQTKAIT